MLILHICSCLSMLLMGTIQLDNGLDTVYKYMTTLSTNTLPPAIISPSDLRKLLTEIERNLISHP